MKFVLPSNLPPLEVCFFVAGATFNIVVMPVQLRASITTDPASIDINVYINGNLTGYIDGDVRGRNRLSQSRCRCNRGQERDGDFEGGRCSIDTVGQVSRRRIKAMT